MKFKLIYKDWFDTKAKVHNFYKIEDARYFLQHNKIIEVIAFRKLTK